MSEKKKKKKKAHRLSCVNCHWLPSGASRNAQNALFADFCPRGVRILASLPRWRVVCTFSKHVYHSDGAVLSRFVSEISGCVRNGEGCKISRAHRWFRSLVCFSFMFLVRQPDQRWRDVVVFPWGLVYPLIEH